MKFHLDTAEVYIPENLDIVVDKDDELTLQPAHLFNHFFNRSTPIGLPKKMGDVTEVALVWTTPRRLDTVHRHVGVFTKKISPGMGHPLQGRKGIGLVKGFQASLLKIFNQASPDIFCLTHDHRIRMLFGFDGKA